MIKQIDDEAQFEGYAVTDIFSVRILSLLGAYGCKYPFARFYRQIDENETVTAILIKNGKDRRKRGNSRVRFSDRLRFRFMLRIADEFKYL